MAPRPTRFSDELLDRMIAIYRRRTSKEITRDKAQVMLSDLTQLFLILHKADLQQRRSGNQEVPTPPKIRGPHRQRR